MVNVENTKKQLPIMPDVLRENYRKLGLNENQIKTIIAARDLCEFYEQERKLCDANVLANYLTGDILSFLNH